MTKLLKIAILSATVGGSSVVVGTVVGTQTTSNIVEQDSDINDSNNGDNSSSNGSGSNILTKAKYVQKLTYIEKIIANEYSQSAFEEVLFNNQTNIINTILNNNNLFNGVDLTYVKNSCELVDNVLNAKYVISLKKGFCWEDNSINSSKQLIVTFTNIDVYQFTSFVPQTDEYMNEVIVSNDQEFANHFGSELYNGTFLNNLKHQASWNGVSIEINNCDALARIVYINATPIDGYKWSDNTNETKVVTIKVLNSTIKSSRMPINSTFNPELSFTTNSELNQYFENFAFDDMSQFTNNNQFKNVDIKYCLNSANISKKQIKLLVTPKQGYAWEDGTKNTSELIVSLNIKQATPAKKYASVGSFNGESLYLKQEPIASINNHQGWNQAFESINWSDYNNIFTTNYGFSNVSVNYQKNSYSNQMFYIEIKPLDGYVWQNGGYSFVNGSLVWQNGDNSNTRIYRVRFNNKPKVAVSLPSILTINYGSSISMSYNQFVSDYNNAKTNVSQLANQYFADYGVICYNTTSYISKISNTSNSTTFNITFDLNNQSHFQEQFYWADSSSPYSSKTVGITYMNLVVK